MNLKWHGLVATLLSGLTWTLPAAASCMLDVQPVLFGSYDTLTGMAVDGIGQIEVQCTPAADYVLSLMPGQGSYDVRELRSGAATIRYNLYLDPARARPAGQHQRPHLAAGNLRLELPQLAGADVGITNGRIIGIG